MRGKMRASAPLSGKQGFSYNEVKLAFVFGACAVHTVFVVWPLWLESLSLACFVDSLSNLSAVPLLAVCLLSTTCAGILSQNHGHIAFFLGSVFYLACHSYSNFGLFLLAVLALAYLVVTLVPNACRSVRRFVMEGLLGRAVTLIMSFIRILNYVSDICLHSNTFYTHEQGSGTN